MADRMYMSDKHQSYIEANKGLLLLNALERKDIMFIALALGMNDPKKITSKKSGWVLYQYFNTKDRALIEAVRLGAEDISDSNINNFSEFQVCVDYAEQCVESGVEKLAQIIQKANGNNDELVAELMLELDRLYRKNVEK